MKLVKTYVTIYNGDKNQIKILDKIAHEDFYINSGAIECNITRGRVYVNNGRILASLAQDVNNAISEYLGYGTASAEICIEVVVDNEEKEHMIDI